MKRSDFWLLLGCIMVATHCTEAFALGAATFFALAGLVSGLLGK